MSQDYFDQTGTMDTTETGGPLNSIAPVFAEAQKRAEAQSAHVERQPAPAVTPQDMGPAAKYDVGGPAAEQPEGPATVDYDTLNQPQE